MSKAARLPAFHGERLREAREVRQMTATALAERLSVSPAAISSWEKGKARPRGLMIEALSKVLELPEPYFLRPPSTTAPEYFRFRSVTAATKRARAAAQVRAGWLHEITEFLDEHLDLPAMNIPDLRLPNNPEDITREDIEQAALKTREAWGLRDGPIPNVGKLVEANGVMVTRLALNATGLDGLSGWSTTGRAYIVLNSEKASAVRSRFDVSHELGHLVLHRGAPLRPKPELHKLMESQAHSFASAFIFPSSAVVDEVASTDLDSLVRLKARWRLSVAAILFRLKDNGLVDANRLDRLHRQISARGWRRQEPYDEEWEAERPTVVRQAYQLLCEEASWTPADIQRAVPLGDHDHELITGLPHQWMRGQHKQFGDLVKLPSVPREGGERGPERASGARVFRLPQRSPE